MLLGKGPSKDLSPEIREGIFPRPEYIEVAKRTNALLSSYNQTKESRGKLSRLVFDRRPVLGSVTSAISMRNAFDRIYVTGEEVGLRLALALSALSWRGKLVMVVHNADNPKRRRLLKLIGPKIFAAIIVVSQYQRRIFVDDLGFPPNLIHFAYNWVDTDFFAPQNEAVRGDYIFSCGLENRDYDTLSAAATVLEMPFKIVASGWMSMSGMSATSAIALPSNVSVESNLTYPVLRSRYSQSRFVVVPLHPVPYAAGVTGVMEAMAMGKAVIATDSPGIKEYLAEGESGIIVPPNDSAAMANAISSLWATPDRALAMGRRNRQWAACNANVQDYGRRIADLMAEA